MAFVSVPRSIYTRIWMVWRGLTRSTHSASPYIYSGETEAQDDLPIDLDHDPYEKDKPQCILCKLNIEPDYKNVRMLSQFQSRYTGKIYGRHITGLCKGKQEKIEKEIFKAQNAGLMGYYAKNLSYVEDPKLFDPDNPFRPHKY
ncbi:28S ribosomal protein S18c, mitochondrial [Orussus abietinus]|uniref:28S ribosomal protein S18c, mitochondrial n=1 Tax=Orussus abietinus TaxID=222816 RepID=UPI0006252730|nr:28S ribosomal protein S18c, mitochondrial [Orussus abietinus]